MHQTRNESSKKLPIPRKGTKYVVRASSHIQNSVPAVIAVRDMLHLAQNAKEVREMIKRKSLKLNGKAIKDYRESIRLFNILEVGKNSYKLTLLPTGKFSLEESKDKDTRLCKVVDKRILSENIIQLNLHDGSNIITKDKINIGDSLYIDFSGKAKKHIALTEGKKVFVFEGKHRGNTGTIESIKDNHLLIRINHEEKAVEIDKSRFIVL